MTAKPSPRSRHRLHAEDPGGAERPAPTRRKRPGTAAALAPVKVTMKDVAHQAGVSLMTVSNVVNGKLGMMSADTRARVEEAIRRLRYRPHFSGRNLRLAKRLSIGMIIVDRSPTFLADPFTTRLVAGLSNCLSERGYSLTLQGLKPESFADALCVKNIRTDGLCAVFSGTEEERSHCARILEGLGLPIVVFQEWDALSSADVCVIRQDDRAGGRWVAGHLIERGAKDLLLLLPRIVWPAFEERRAGVHEAVAAAKPRPRLRTLACEDAGFDNVQAALRRHVDAGNALPDAVIGLNDQIGIAALKFFQALSIRVPERMMITGFNGFEFRAHSDPVLTTVVSPAYEMGTRGGIELIARIQSGRFRDRVITLPVRPDQGGST